ncbi:5-carboxymethyl-2-hydroxymuconate Delta-isomerase [Pusillimonas sp. T7-7]|uniref:fumarylacetoacetate hydrolase family protein n=1 Tax=Pusillimonas sp. (strain T7-7) TaxID=1007105 RepID=UPI0002084525|nr:fumarylacetoacetate hydrolase family protein [Pusillimonas sp. T7-7]AEC22088.1 5-carboxymethyl-2-hydroxymuconate Delta-isomerase [Pusillimonas sp. T7-7]
MKVSRFLSDGREGWAVRDSATGAWHGCTEDHASYPGPLDTQIKKGAAALAGAAGIMLRQTSLDLQTARLLPPVAHPPKIICVGLNYIDHSEESGFEQPTYPTLFSRFNTSVVAHAEPLIYPALSPTFDYEGELAVIIGKPGKDISRENALDHVLGYSIFNDGSVREYQFKTPQWTMGKNFDGTGAFGPWLVTADELPAGARGLKLETRLNGVTVQSANTKDMVFDVESLIATISEVMTLEAGDVIVAGTPSGIGHAREPKLYMQPGDLCEVEIEGIGLLSNRVQQAGLA